MNECENSLGSPNAGALPHKGATSDEISAALSKQLQNKEWQTARRKTSREPIVRLANEFEEAINIWEQHAASLVEFELRENPDKYFSRLNPQSGLPERRDGYLYAFQLGPFTKIGCTLENAKKRKLGFRCHCPFSIKTRHTIEIGSAELRAAERYAHYLLDGFKHRNEWFVIPTGFAIIEKTFEAVERLALLMAERDRTETAEYWRRQKEIENEAAAAEQEAANRS